MYKLLQLSYILRTNKKRKDGTAPIYLRIRVNGTTAELSASRTILPERWNYDGSCVKGNKDDARSINSYLDSLKGMANESHRRLVQEGLPITAKNVKKLMMGDEVNQVPFLDVFRDHNKRMKSLIGADYAKATYKKYRTCLKHMKAFIEDHSLPVSKIDLEFLEDFEYYLKTKKNPCSHNSALKYMSHFSKIMNIALKKGLIRQTPFDKYDATYKKKDPVYLTQNELEAIEEKELEIERLRRVRDIFVFSCYTGLSFIDAEKLTRNDIKFDNKGSLYLSVSRTKTKESVKIMLLPKAMKIIKRYEEDPETQGGKLLPMISNQKTNAYLKEIAAVCGIDKKLTHHVARHTCATTVLLENEVPVETVQKILGHAQLSTTMHYARVTSSKINRDMDQLKKRLASQPK